MLLNHFILGPLLVEQLIGRFFSSPTPRRLVWIWLPATVAASLVALFLMHYWGFHVYFRAQGKHWSNKKKNALCQRKLIKFRIELTSAGDAPTLAFPLRIPSSVTQLLGHVCSWGNQRFPRPCTGVIIHHEEIDEEGEKESISTKKERSTRVRCHVPESIIFLLICPAN